MEKIIYNTQGTCSKQIVMEIEEDIIKNIEFYGGCQGNLQGISSLVLGMNIHEVKERLKGIKCGAKPTSCPDQLAICIEKYIEEKSKVSV